MRVPDEVLDEVRERGYAVLPGFLSGHELAYAQAGLWSRYPRPEEYFADPAAHAALTATQFSGMRHYPYSDLGLDLLPVHPDLVDAAERFLGSTDLDLYKVELWAKYSGSVDYGQPHHRDFGNHTLLTPSRDPRYAQLTTFVLLSDVTERDGPTKIVPLQLTADLPFEPLEQDPSFSHSVRRGAYADVEQSITGSAGALLLYRTDVLHRGSSMTGEGRSRFALLADFKRRGTWWAGKHAWGGFADRPGWDAALAAMTVRQRELFGVPPPGHDFWDAQTVADVGARYPSVDMGPYDRASSSAQR